MTGRCQEHITVNFSPISRLLPILPEVGSQYHFTIFGSFGPTAGHRWSFAFGVNYSRSLRSAQSRTASGICDKRVPSLGWRPSLGLTAVIKLF
jgi:hypothetical protein